LAHFGIGIFLDREFLRTQISNCMSGTLKFFMDHCEKFASLAPSQNAATIREEFNQAKLVVTGRAIGK
jgi:hypothetical protein